MKTKNKTGRILQSIWQTFKDLFPDFIDKTYKKIEPELRQEISWITQIVSKINDVLKSPVVDIATALIPGNADEEFVKWAKIVVPKLLESLKANNVDYLSPSDKAIASAKLTMDRSNIELSQALITSQVVYKKESRTV